VKRHLALAVAALLLVSPAAGFAQHPHEHGQPPAPAPKPPVHDPHAGHADHAQHDDDAPSLPSFIPPLTDADRAAAFPDVQGHTVHDNAVHYFVRLDELEWQRVRGESGAGWEAKGWIGRDLDRFWFRTKGDGRDGRIDHAEVHALYGRAIARWWDVVAGVRQDVRPGPAQTWAAIGLQGLAPYWFEVEATAYLSASGRTHLRVETEYELLLTNRLILQPLVEFDIYGKADPERGIGAGLSSAEAGLRLRYEVRREFAPYIGVVWNRRFFGTADFAEAGGHPTSGAGLVLGVRLWR
jgi:copper resistance protein B